MHLCTFARVATQAAVLALTLIKNASVDQEKKIPLLFSLNLFLLLLTLFI